MTAGMIAQCYIIPILYSILQLVVLLPTQILHRHDLHHQACPPGEMLRPLPSTCGRVVLLPREACPLPLIVDIVHEIRA